MALACALALAAAGGPGPALALEGRAEVRGNTQEGVALGLDYRTSTLTETYQLGQRRGFSPRWDVRAGYLVRRENTESRSGDLSTDLRRVSLLPDFGLSFRNDFLRAGLTGSGLRKDEFLQDEAMRRDDRLDSGAWVRAVTTAVETEVRWQLTRAWRYEAAGDRRTEDDILSASALARPSASDEVSYKFTNADHEVPTSGSFTRFRTHALTYGGSHDFAGGRGRAYLQVRSSHFRQENRYGDGARELLQPIFAGLMLDDTPQISDPLEPEAVAVAGLTDGDRQGATTVQIGDSAPAVREFGGDYRNLILEFGETIAVSHAVLYVDARVDFPQFMQWQVYATEDPERRDWGLALSPAAVTAAYREWENGEQGWEFTFAAPASARSVKFVDVKTGPTEPELAVTELEVYTTAQGASYASTLVRHRLIGEVGYQAAADLHLRYSTDLSQRRFEDESRNLTGSNHTFGGQWTPGTWTLGAQHSLSRLGSDRETTTDADNQLVSLSSDPARDVQGKLTWARFADRSAGRDQVTSNWTIDGNWDIAPDLVLHQRAGVGTRSFELTATSTRSWFVMVEMRGAPKPNLNLDLRRSDRWSESETGGTGFTTFNETEFLVDWSLLPLVNWSSMTRYQVRGDRDDWLLRNNVSWSPAPGGRLSLQVFASDYQDTALSIIQRGGGASLVWRPFARMTLEGGAEELYTRQGGERNSPTNVHFRGNWTF